MPQGRATESCSRAVIGPGSLALARYKTLSVPGSISARHANATPESVLRTTYFVQHVEGPIMSLLEGHAFSGNSSGKLGSLHSSARRWCYGQSIPAALPPPRCRPPDSVRARLASGMAASIIAPDFLHILNRVDTAKRRRSILHSSDRSGRYMPLQAHLVSTAKMLQSSSSALYFPCRTHPV
jgi:hypothetical protein